MDEANVLLLCMMLGDGMGLAIKRGIVPRLAGNRNVIRTIMNVSRHIEV